MSTSKKLIYRSIGLMILMAVLMFALSMQATAAIPPVGNCTQCHDYTKHSVSNCAQCHDNAKFEVTSTLPGGHGGLKMPDGKKSLATAPVGNCQECHKYTDSYNNLCKNCHPTYWSRYGYTPGPLTPDALIQWDSNYTHDATRINNYVGMDTTYNCESCHIQNNWTSIPQMPHDTDEVRHIVGMGSACVSCHANDLIEVHEKVSLTCATCHDSTTPVIQKALAFANKGCGSCHTMAHKANILPDVPVDVLYYPGLKWGVPVPLAASNGESWVEGDPTGYSVIISTRANITSDSVWSFYNDGLTSKGWTLVSEPPAAGCASFKAKFVKDADTMIIWFYGSEDHSGAGAVPTGSRIEIIFN